MIEPEDYCAIVCREPDRLRIVNAHDEVVEAVQTCLSLNQIEFSFYLKSKATCAFKLKNSPFSVAGCSENETIQLKRALAASIEKLQSLSWHIVINTDIGKMKTNSCIFLRKIVVFDQIKRNKLIRDGNIFTFSPSGVSSILLIDVPEHVEKDLVDGVKSLCSVNNYKVISSIDDGAVVTSKVSLSGFTWTASGAHAIALRRMILEVVKIARKHKFELVTNLNLKGTTDSLLFQHKASLLDGPEDMFLMSLNRNDRLRLICAPSYIVTAGEEMISQNWGVQACKQKEDDCYEFKLYGNPWWADGETAVKSRYLIAVIIAKFKSLGWEIGATVDVSRKLNDKSVFVFRQCPPEQQEFAVLSFHESDKLRFLSSTENTYLLTDGIDRILAESDMTKSISYYWRAKQWKLRGVPFSGNPTYGVDLRLIIHHLTRILKHFHKHGWRLVASADISAKYEGNSSGNKYPLDTHSLFFLHDPDSMILSDTVLTIDTDDTNDCGENEFGDQFCVDEIKSEKSQLRYIIRVVLPAIFVFGLVLYYIFTIVS